MSGNEIVWDCQSRVPTNLVQLLTIDTGPTYPLYQTCNLSQSESCGPQCNKSGSFLARPGIKSENAKRLWERLTCGLINCGQLGHGGKRRRSAICGAVLPGSIHAEGAAVPHAQAAWDDAAKVVTCAAEMSFCPELLGTLQQKLLPAQHTGSRVLSHSIREANMVAYAWSVQSHTVRLHRKCVACAA